jgi:hypothetical protein
MQQLQSKKKSVSAASEVVANPIEIGMASEFHKSEEIFLYI